LCKTALSGSSSYKSLISIFLFIRHFTAVFSNWFALPCYLSLLFEVMKCAKKEKRKVLGQQNNQSQDLRRQKLNFSKKQRKLWPTTARDRAYTRTRVLTPLIIIWLLHRCIPKFNKENMAITLLLPWNSHKNPLWMLGVPRFHWLATYSVDIHPSKRVTCLQLFKRR